MLLVFHALMLKRKTEYVQNLLMRLWNDERILVVGGGACVFKLTIWSKRDNFLSIRHKTFFESILWMGSSKILLYNMGMIIIIAPPELCYFQNILLIRIGLTMSVAWKTDGDHISCFCIILVSLFSFLELQNYWICCYIILMIHLRFRA